METSKSNDTFREGAKVFEKWLNDSNSAITDIYNKQLNLTTKFYDNLLNSTVGNSSNFWDGRSLVDSFFKGDLVKRFSFPFSGNGNGNSILTPSLTNFENSYKQMVEFNRNWLSAYSERYNKNNSEWNTISEDYMKLFEKRLESSKKIFNSYVESFDNGLDFSVKNNKKILEEITEQFNLLNNQSQKFWADILKTTEIKTEEEKIKDSNINGNKKRNTSQVAV